MIPRVLAVLIAIAGTADPAITLSRPVRQSLMITVVNTSSLAFPEGNGTRRDQAYRSAQALAGALSHEYSVTVREQPVNSAADPCPQEGACIVISDGVRPRVLQARQGVLGGVRVGSTPRSNVAIVAVNSPPATSSAARASIDVGLEARGFGGRTTRVEVLDGGVVVGAAAHTWPPSAAGSDATANVRVEWTPLASGVRDLRVVASGSPDEAITADNEARTTAAVMRQRFNVLVYEPQPSWGSTFVRRALETDTRFNVVRRARLGSMHTAPSTMAALNADALERDNFAVVVVASPQLLGRGEVDALERLVRLRGAAVVLLLDVPPAGGVAELLRATGIARREAEPVAIGPLKASELIVLRALDRTASAVASAGADPVVLSRPLGHGHLVASGAVDAWRVRAASGFDAFWKSLVVDAAQTAGDALVLTLSAPVVATGDPVGVDVEWRSVHEITEPLEAQGLLRCGSHETVIRLWPSSMRGRFRAAFDAPAPGECTVEANVTPLGSAVASLRITDTAPGPLGQRDELTAALRAHGGTTVAAGDEGMLVTQLRALISPQRRSTPVHPMRSPWWIAPFTACLGLHWWQRRRKGLL